MTAFDAHLQRAGSASAWHRATGLVGARPGVVLASIVAAATVACLALVVLLAGQEVRFHAGRAVDGLQASVFLRPQTPRPAAEALKAQLDALPFVRGATLRGKEAAIVALETGGLPPLNARPNPLPDVWVVTLGFGSPDGAAKQLSGQVADARRVLAGLAEVESVDVDAEWVATLERWQTASATGGRVAGVAAFSVAGLLLTCVYWLAGRALAGATPLPERAPSDGAAAAIVGALIAVGTLAITAGFAGAVLLACGEAGLDWKPIVERAGRTTVEPVVVLATGTAVLAVLAVWAAARRR